MPMRGGAIRLLVGPMLVGSLLGACGGASVSTTSSATITATMTTTAGAPVMTLEEGALGPAPEDVDGHLHETPSYVADLDRLYVEITSDGEHADVLRESASTALAKLPFVVSVDDGGELEIHVELASLTPAADGAACKIKIFLMRLPQHDLLGIADGSGRVIGDRPTDACLSTMGTTIVANKLPPFLQRQLDAKQ